MKAKILKVTKNPSQYGGHFYYVFFLGEDGKSYQTCVASKCKNSARWFKHISTSTKEIWLDNLKVKHGNLIDADSKFEVLGKDKNEVLQNGLFDKVVDK